MRLENRIGCRVTKNTLKAIVGIGLPQGFPAPRRFHFEAICHRTEVLPFCQSWQIRG
jgi:hypothetical protein